MQFSFTNNTFFTVLLSSVDPTSNQELREGDIAPGTTTIFDRDILIGTEWRMKNSETGAMAGMYRTTADQFQPYLIGGHRIQLQFNNHTSSSVVLFSVDPISKQETREGEVVQGTSTLLNRNAHSGTEWRIKDAQTGAMVNTYATTADPYQSFSIFPPITPIVVYSEEVISVPIPDTATPPLTITPASVPPITIASAKDTIFNSKSFNMTVANLDYLVRKHTGITDRKELRAAIYARLLEIAKTPNRTRDEQACMDWLALQVKQTRVEAARLALAEYDRWQQDPWSYEPPAGYDFPAYVIPTPHSPLWLTTTPNPPVLANTSWQSFFAGIVSNNGWSPLNNPMLTKGEKSSSLENVIGFPVFGTVRAYQKIYGDDEGTKTFAETTAHLTTQSFNPPPVGGAVAAPANVNTIRVSYLRNIAPFSDRNLGILVRELVNRAAGLAGRIPIAKPQDTVQIAKTLSSSQLRAAVAKITSGDIIGSFITSFILSCALQEIIHESMMLDVKLKLRAKLLENLEKQQAAPLPDLGNLLYYDIRGEIVLYDSDYQPTDPVELERLMGVNEVYRAFLLSTIE
jgi:hypothetical protein